MTNSEIQRWLKLIFWSQYDLIQPNSLEDKGGFSSVPLLPLLNTHTTDENSTDQWHSELIYDTI